jgi:hypothetical protein
VLELSQERTQKRWQWISLVFLSILKVHPSNSPQLFMGNQVPTLPANFNQETTLYTTTILQVG